MKFKPGDKVKTIRVLYDSDLVPISVGTFCTVFNSYTLAIQGSNPVKYVKVAVNDVTVELVEEKKAYEHTRGEVCPEELKAAFECEDEPETSAKPHRYNQTDLEYWDAAKGLGWDYMQGTTGKYLHRYKDKNGPEDLCKAINYIIKMLSQETGIDYYELHKLTPEQLAKRVKK